MLPGVRSVPGQPERDGKLAVRESGTHGLGPRDRLHGGPVLLRRCAPDRPATVPEDNLPAVQADLLRLPRAPGSHDVRLDPDGRTPAPAQRARGEFYFLFLHYFEISVSSETMQTYVKERVLEKRQRLFTNPHLKKKL